MFDPVMTQSRCSGKLITVVIRDARSCMDGRYRAVRRGDSGSHVMANQTYLATSRSRADPMTLFGSTDRRSAPRQGREREGCGGPTSSQLKTPYEGVPVGRGQG